MRTLHLNLGHTIISLTPVFQTPTLVRKQSVYGTGLLLVSLLDVNYQSIPPLSIVNPARS